MGNDQVLKGKGVECDKRHPGVTRERRPNNHSTARARCTRPNRLRLVSGALEKLRASLPVVILAWSPSLVWSFRRKFKLK